MIDIEQLSSTKLTSRQNRRGAAILLLVAIAVISFCHLDEPQGATGNGRRALLSNEGMEMPWRGNKHNNVVDFKDRQSQRALRGQEEDYYDEPVVANNNNNSNNKRLLNNNNIIDDLEVTGEILPRTMSEAIERHYQRKMFIFDRYVSIFVLI